MPTEEIAQIVDENDKPLGGTTSDDMRTKGLWYRVARVMVEDGQGNILLQKRLNSKRLFPDRWDNSAAGVVAQGESYEESAARELDEEMGISNVKLTEICYY